MSFSKKANHPSPYQLVSGVRESEKDGKIALHQRLVSSSAAILLHFSFPPPKQKQKRKNMFSSTNSGNPFQHLPSLFHQSPPPLPFLGHESDDTFLHHHHNSDFLVAHFPPPPPAPNNASSLAEAVISMAVANNHPIHTTPTLHDCSYGGPSGAGFLPGKKTVKKDRHSKITTAKGPRERRVRLSIKIARKFFDLQDMLGFDKASRTLEWLLINSKSAIKEVVRMKSSCKSLSSASSECEVLSGANDQTGGPPDVGVPSGRESEVKKARESEDKAAAFNLLARESRAKARARARERTREKMCTRSLDEPKKIPHHYNHHHHIFSQLRSSAQAQAHEKLGGGGGGGGISTASHTHQSIASSLKLVSQVEESSSRPNSSTSSRANLSNIIEESIFIKRKLKQAPLFATSPQNHLLFSKDLSLNSSSSNNNSYFPHPPQNWDINTPTARSNTFCAMTDMNLSTEFQMLGKPLDAHNNLSLR